MLVPVVGAAAAEVLLHHGYQTHRPSGLGDCGCEQTAFALGELVESVYEVFRRDGGKILKLGTACIPGFPGSAQEILSDCGLPAGLGFGYRAGDMESVDCVETLFGRNECERRDSNPSSNLGKVK